MPEASGSEDLDSLSDHELAWKLLKTTGGEKLARQAIEQMTQSFEKLNVPEGFGERFRAEADPNALNELMVEVYLKHYPRATMIAAIRFYESPQGRIMVEKLPIVTAEGMEVGMAWGQTLAGEVAEEMAK